MFCNNCGAQLSDGAVFCAKCGKKITSGMGQEQDTQGRSQTSQFQNDTQRADNSKSTPKGMEFYRQLVDKLESQPNALNRWIGLILGVVGCFVGWYLSGLLGGILGLLGIFFGIYSKNDLNKIGSCIAGGIAVIFLLIAMFGSV